MRFDEFETASDKAARVYKKKQADKAKLERQRELARSNNPNKDDQNIKADVMTAIDKLLANSDDKSIRTTIIKTENL